MDMGYGMLSHGLRGQRFRSSRRAIRNAVEKLDRSARRFSFMKSASEILPHSFSQYHRFKTIGGLR